MAVYRGTKYNLTDTQVKKLARLCYQEQGSSAAAAEASLMANLYELQGKKKFSSLYEYVRNGKWFYRAAYYMDNGTASASVVKSVKDVLVNGNRVLPLYIDEHDCLSDIVSVTNNSKAVNKSDRSNYKRGISVIKNRYGSTYTFYSFPSVYSDPFGYTKNSRAPKSAPAEDPVETVTISNIKMPVLSDGSTGAAVRVWQAIIECSVDGIFGDYTEQRTKAWQEKHGLSADGIVGAKSWAAGFKSI